MKLKIKSIIFLLYFAFSSFLYAEKISFSASSMTAQSSGENTSTKLIGDAFVRTSTIEVLADVIEMHGENYRYIKARGNISGKNLETNMEFSCDSLEYDRQTKLAILQGDVNLKDIENNLTAKAQIIEYNQETEVAVLQIEVNIVQKENTCNGSYAVYKKNEQSLIISGNAQVKQKEDTFRAQQISLNLETQEISLMGNVSGTVTQEKKEGEDVSN